MRRFKITVDVTKKLFGFSAFVTENDLLNAAKMACKENGFSYVSHKYEGGKLIVIGTK